MTPSERRRAGTAAPAASREPLQRAEAPGRRELTLLQAVTEGLATALAEDERVIVLGEDVGKNGGVFRATDGLQERFGPERVVDTPLAESAIVGASIGLAAAGLRPIAEIQFMGFVYPALDQLISHASRLRSRSRGRYGAPLVVRMPYGGGVRAPELHSESAEVHLVHTPGLKVVVPSTPADAKGLILAAVADPDPVVVMEPMRLYRSVKGHVPEEAVPTPIGPARVVREGEDAVVFCWGAMVPPALAAARLAEERLSARVAVVDLRTLAPLDRDAIGEWARRTGRVLVVHEAPRTAGLGAEVLAIAQEEAFWHLRARPRRVTGPDAPFPYFSLEDWYLPDAQRILAALEETLAET
ncbi:MAG: alpha-ketoacid dehydrogenase subunit beta [Clostridia bacterium]|nr:alpha-ketoacid dehydrogenase subunit beta [Clostridia bacterium]